MTETAGALEASKGSTLFKRLQQAVHNHRFGALIAVEIAYWALSRVVVKQFGSAPVTCELVRTVLRLVSFGLDSWLYWPLIRARTTSLCALGRPGLWLGLLLFMAAPLVMMRHVPAPEIALVYAATSIVVALKEELLFRGIIQHRLEDKLGRVLAIILSTSAFALWHYGLVRIEPWVVGQMCVASALIGTVYAYSGSFAAAVAIHACYDALWYAPPVLPLSPTFAFVLLLAALVSVVAWALKVGGVPVLARLRQAAGRGRETS